MVPCQESRFCYLVEGRVASMALGLSVKCIGLETKAMALRLFQKFLF